MRKNTKREWRLLSSAMVRAPEASKLLLERYLRQPVMWSADQKVRLEGLLQRNKKRTESLLQAVWDVDYTQMAALLQSLDAALLDELLGPLPERDETSYREENPFQSLRREPLQGANQGIAWLLEEWDSEEEDFAKKQHLRSLIHLDLDHVHRRLLREFAQGDESLVEDLAWSFAQRRCLDTFPLLLERAKSSKSLSHRLSLLETLSFYGPLLEGHLDIFLPVFQELSPWQRSRLLRILKKYASSEKVYSFLEETFQLFVPHATKSDTYQKRFSLIDADSIARELTDWVIPASLRGFFRTLMRQVSPQHQCSFLPLLGSDPSEEAGEILLEFFCKGALDLQHAAGAGIIRYLHHRPAFLLRLLLLEEENLKSLEFLKEKASLSEEEESEKEEASPKKLSMDTRLFGEDEKELGVALEDTLARIRELGDVPVPSIFERIPSGRGAIAQWIGLHRYQAALPLLKYWFHQENLHGWDFSSVVVALARLGDLCVLPFIREHLPLLMGDFHAMDWSGGLALRAVRVLLPKDPSMMTLYAEIWNQIPFRKDGHWVRLVWARSFPDVGLSLEQCLALLFFLEREILDTNDEAQRREALTEMQFVLECLQGYRDLLGEEACELVGEYFASRFLFLPREKQVQEKVEKLNNLFQTLHPKFKEQLEKQRIVLESTLFQEF